MSMTVFVINEGSLELPSSWKDETVNMFTTVQGTGGGGLSFTISRDTLPWGMTFASFARKEVDTLAANFKHYEQIALEPLEVGGREGLLSEFRWDSAHGPIHQCMVLTAEGERVLAFTASMPGRMSEEQKQQVLERIATFRFKEPPAEDEGQS
ncbi:MAG: DcrB-related protein [Xanthomonadaceae bacterium]|jgi:hypothetical protein|nr:DcrB-related protein [Xanthomonadaceae bacterium]